MRADFGKRGSKEEGACDRSELIFGKRRSQERAACDQDELILVKDGHKSSPLVPTNRSPLLQPKTNQNK
ncbi:hypothetical protein [Salipaludibacillus daqingensis]|uniref:hypothetical protein n=1 Tax=Salipaludibacillus daqingensis TaxID=3041001 RepID=UPI002472FEC4|nr:hypothetical protein [Salipaludibacillus daqingensis]